MLHPEAFRRLGRQVYVALCHNDALAQLDRTFWADEQSAGGSGNVPGEPHGRGESQLAAVRQGDLHLTRLPLRAQHGHVLKVTLGPLHRYPLPGKKLPRLAERPLRRQGMAEQGHGLLPGNMHMPPGGLQFHKHPPENRLGQAGNVHSDSSFYTKAFPWGKVACR